MAEETKINIGQTPKVGANPDKGHTPGQESGQRGNEYNKIQDKIDSFDKGRISKQKKNYHA